MRFVANLRQETIEAFAAQDTQPAAFLLSSHRVTVPNLKAAAVIRALNIPLFADNGSKILIENTVEVFGDQAKNVRDMVNRLRRQLGHVPRGMDVPKGLRSAASDLAVKVVKHATDVSEAIDHQDLLDAQLSMNPTDLIAKEDFATACLIALGLERETTGWSIPRIDARNRRSLRLWKKVAVDPRCKRIRVYAVLSAMDYNTARSAGRLAAKEGVRNVAIGIAGIALDSSATDFFVLGRTSIRLTRAAPRRFVRLAQILKGLADGYADLGNAPEHFHCLGLGGPALLPIPAAAISEATSVTTDATSPIHDAVRDRVLYDPDADGDRASTQEIVERIVCGGDWSFRSPFTRTFRKQFGHEPEKARAWWEEMDRPQITKTLLQTPSELTRALPLFSEADLNVRAAALTGC